MKISLKSITKYFQSDKLIKDILTVLSGTVISQVILIGSTYFFAKLYSPNSFGSFTIFLSLSTVIVQIIALRYEQALVLAKENEIGLLFFIIILICLIFGLFSLYVANILMTYGLVGNQLSMTLGLKTVFIIYTISSGIWNCCQYLFIRNSLYKIISMVSVIRSLSMVLFTFIIYLFNPKINGLIYGMAIGQVIGTLVNCIFLRKRVNLFIQRFSLMEVRKLLFKYRKFPIFQFPSVLVETISGQLLTFFLGLNFPLKIVGFFSLANRTVNAPMDLIGGAVRTVFWEKASKDVELNGNCSKLFNATFKKLFFLSLIPTIVLFFWGKVLFFLIFGKEWEMSGTFASILSFMVFFRFLSSPLSSMFAIKNKQSIDLLIQIFILVVQVLFFFKFKLFINNPIYAIYAFGIIYSIKYLLELYFSYKFSKDNP